MLLAFLLFMNLKLFTDWVINDCILNFTKFYKENGKSWKVLLIFNNVLSHHSAETLNNIDNEFNIMVFPSNVLALFQPMDQRVSEKLKIIYKKQVTRSLILEESEPEKFIAFAKKLDLKYSYQMLADAWLLFTMDNLQNTWKNYGPLLRKQNQIIRITEGDQEQILSEMTSLSLQFPGLKILMKRMQLDRQMQLEDR